MPLSDKGAKVAEAGFHNEFNSRPGGKDLLGEET